MRRVATKRTTRAAAVVGEVRRGKRPGARRARSTHLAHQRSRAPDRDHAVILAPVRRRGRDGRRPRGQHGATFSVSPATTRAVGRIGRIACALSRTCSILRAPVAAIRSARRDMVARRGYDARPALGAGLGSVAERWCRVEVTSAVGVSPGLGVTPPPTRRPHASHTPPGNGAPAPLTHPPPPRAAATTLPHCSRSVPRTRRR